MHLFELLQQLVSCEGGSTSDANPVQAAFTRYPMMPVGDFVRLMSEAVVELQRQQQLLQQQQLESTGCSNSSTISCSPRGSSSSSSVFTAGGGGGSRMTMVDFFDYSPFKFLALKKELFIAHSAMDADGDGLVSHEDFVDYLLDARKKLLGEVLGETPCFEIAQSMPFRIPRGGSDVPTADSRMRRASTQLFNQQRLSQSRLAPIRMDVVDEDDEDDNALMQFDPITRIKSLSGGRRLFAIGRMHRAGFIATDTHKVLSELARPAQASSSGADIRSERAGSLSWPSARILDADLLSREPVLVTAHRDKSVVLWKEKQGDAGPSAGRLWYPFYDFSCGNVQSAIAAHPSSDIVFTGGTRGDMKMWHLSLDLIADFSRGERTALAKISAKSWAPGERHNGCVTGIAYLRQGLRVVSASLDATVAEYDVEKQHVVKRYVHTSGVHTIAASLHMTDFVVGCGFGPSPCLWDVNASGDKPVLLTDFADPHRQSLVAVSEIAGSTPLLVSCDVTSKVKVWDLRMMTCIQTILVDREGLTEATTKSTNHAAASSGDAVSRIPLATSMTTTRSGQIIVTGRNYNVLESTSLQVSSRQHMQSTIGSVFDAVSDCLLTLHPDCVIRWETGVPRSSYRFLKTHRNASALCIALDPRGRNYFVGWTDGTVKAFKIGTGEYVETFDVLSCDVRAIASSTSSSSSRNGLQQQSGARWYFAAVGADGRVACVVDNVSRPRYIKLGSPPSSATCAATHGPLLVLGTAEGEVMGIHVSSAGPSEHGAIFTFRLEESESVTAVDVVGALGLAVVGTSGSLLVILNLHRCGEKLREIRMPPKIFAPSLSRSGTAGNLGNMRAASVAAMSMSTPLPAHRPAPITSVAALFCSGMSWRVVCGLDDGQLIIFKIERTVVSDDLVSREESDQLLVHYCGPSSLLREAVVSISAAGSIAFASSADGVLVVLGADGGHIATLSMTRKEPLALATNVRLAQEKNRAVIDHVHAFLAALKRKVVLKSLTIRNEARRRESAAAFGTHAHGLHGVTLLAPHEAAARQGAKELSSEPPVVRIAETDGIPQSAIRNFSASARRISAQQQQQQHRRDTIDDLEPQEVVLAIRPHNPILKVQPPPRPVTATPRGNLPIRQAGPQPIIPSRDCAMADLAAASASRPTSAPRKSLFSSGPTVGRLQGQPAQQLQQQQLLVLEAKKGAECSVRELALALADKLQREEESKAKKFTPRRPHSAR